MRLVAASFLLSAFLASPALAQQTTETPFQGPSITLLGGVDVPVVASEAEVDVFYGAQFGYDWQSGKLVYGIEAEVSDSAAEHCFKTFRQGSSISNTDCNAEDRDLYLGGRIGTLVSPSTLIYAKAGFTSLDQTYTHYSGDPAAPSFTTNGTEEGVRAGVGIEQRLGSKLTLKAEYRYSNYNGWHSRHQAGLGLGFRF